MTKLRNINPPKEQSGFSLIEVIISLTICAILGGGLITALYQLGRVNAIDNARVVSVKQVENALFYINRDVQMAQKVEVNGQNYWLKLTWKTWEDNKNIQVVYSYSSQSKLLQRSYSENGGTAAATTVAQYITAVYAQAPNSSAVPPEKAWNIRLTACANSGLEQATETRQVKIMPRPGT